MEIARRGYMQAYISKKCIPCLWKNRPGRWDQARPLTCSKEQDDINDAIEHPEDHGKEVPVATQAKVVSSWQGQPWGYRFLVIHRCVKPVPGYFIFGDPEPFFFRITSIVPVKPGVSSQYLDTTAH